MDGQGRQPRVARNGFRDITESLREKIQGGHVVLGSYLPTERELQIDFGASRTTIRKALAALVDSGWATSVPNRGVVAARGLKSTVNRNVAFIHSGSHVSQILLSHLCWLLEHQGLNLVTMGGRSDFSLDLGLQRAVEHNLLGAIVWPSVGFPDVERVSAIAQNFPVVAVDHPIPGISTDVVTFDHEQAAFDATRHLIRQGARRVGVTGMLDMLEITHQRFSGYLRAMFEAGIQPQAADFQFVHTSGADEPNTAVLESVLRSGSRPDAFLVLQDLFLPNIVAAAHRSGIDVPGGLRLAAVGDDLDIAVSGVRMTAVAFDWEALAVSAVEFLTARLDDLHRPPQKVVVPHELRVRGLCGARPEEWNTQASTPLRHAATHRMAPAHYIFNSRLGADGSPHNSRSGEILV